MEQKANKFNKTLNTISVHIHFQSYHIRYGNYVLRNFIHFMFLTTISFFSEELDNLTATRKKKRFTNFAKVGNFFKNHFLRQLFLIIETNVSYKGVLTLESSIEYIYNDYLEY